MNRFVKRIISISMGFVSVASVVPFTGSASPKTEKELAADIQ